MTDATELDIDAIRARMEAATEGPWEALGSDPYDTVIDTGGASLGCCPDCGVRAGFERADAEFIAHARTDLPAALDEVTRLRAALDEARRERDEALSNCCACHGVEWDRDPLAVGCPECGVNAGHDCTIEVRTGKEQHTVRWIEAPRLRRTITEYAPVVGPWETVEDRS